MIRVNLVQGKQVANLFGAPKVKNSKAAATIKTLPGIMLASALATDKLTTSKSKEKSSCDICAFWECTL